MCRLCVCGSVHVQPCVPERMNFYIRRRKIIASERTERSNLGVSMDLELFFCGGRCTYRMFLNTHKQNFQLTRKTRAFHAALRVLAIMCTFSYFKLVYNAPSITTFMGSCLQCTSENFNHSICNAETILYCLFVTTTHT